MPRLIRSNQHPLRPQGRYVLYWMVAARRFQANAALARAATLAQEHRCPLLVLEGLRCDYRWASARHHRFIMDGMVDQAATAARHGIAYYPYVEPKPGAGSGLLEALAPEAVAVIADDYPTFFLPAMLDAVAARLPVRFECHDSNGLLPMAAADKAFHRAVDFRRHLQRHAIEALAAWQPLMTPLAATTLPKAAVEQLVAEPIRRRWPRTTTADLRNQAFLRRLPIDQGVAPIAVLGGANNAHRFMRRAIDRLRQGEAAPKRQLEIGSGLSPFLHHGHIASVEIVQALLEDQPRWQEHAQATVVRGQREGWWGLPPAIEAFLDQLLTWRELGYGYCHHRPQHEGFHTLPEWAQTTLQDHAADSRPYLYDRMRFEAADTHDDLWNAMQRQLMTEGVIQGYLRMLWGKKILHWSRGPEVAYDIMVELNQRYAIDGRDPNSLSGISWVLGRFDRAWGPERPIFGKVRYMSGANTRRKWDVKPYLARWARLP